ncbi:hypothetical protein FB451DRAFT_1182729 [Mycena latifolia]|nr:hypothetical protein FB451DRAFT_1182729 [Mycena latifolia]
MYTAGAHFDADAAYGPSSRRKDRSKHILRGAEVPCGDRYFDRDSMVSVEIPIQIRRRRTTMACLNCRRHKIKCRPPDESATQACERCALRGLVCQYVSATAHKEELGFDSIHETIAAATSSNARGSPSAPRLPYTGPPPPNRLPRYFGQPLPDLSLATNYAAQLNPALTGSNMEPTDSHSSPSSLAAWGAPMRPIGSPAPHGDPVVIAAAAAHQGFNFAGYEDPFNHPYSRMSNTHGTAYYTE